MNNHNNYPELILDFCHKMSNAIWDSQSRDPIKSKDFLDQAVYDVISPIIFKQFLDGKDTDILLSNSVEDSTKLVYEIYAQMDLLSLAEKGLITTYNDGFSFVLTEKGREYYGKNKSDK